MVKLMSDQECELDRKVTLLEQQCSALEKQVAQHVQQIRRLFILCGVLVAFSGGINLYGSEPGGAGRLSPQFLDLILLLAGGGSAAYGVIPGAGRGQQVLQQEEDVVNE
jgi:hypothetical protein